MQTPAAAAAPPPALPALAGRLSDERLVAAVREGDDPAFECLYDRYGRRVAGFVAGMVHDHGRAEDVTQEVFVSALRRLRATDAPIAFKPWVFEIARNACIDAHRRGRRAELVSLDGGGEDGEGTRGGRLAGAGPHAGRRRGGQAPARVAHRGLRRAQRRPPRDPRDARARRAELPGDRRRGWG